MKTAEAIKEETKAEEAVVAEEPAKVESIYESADYKAIRKNLKWFADPFEVPEDIAYNWSLAGEKSDEEYKAW